MRFPLSTTLPALILILGLGAVAIGAAIVSWRVPAEVMDEAEADTTLLASLQSAELAYHLRHGQVDNVLNIIDRSNADRSMVNALLIDDQGRITLANRNALLDRTVDDTRYAGMAEAIRSVSRQSTHLTWSDGEQREVFSLFPVLLDPAEGELATNRTGVFLLHRDVSGMVAERLGLAREILGWLAGIVGLVSLAFWWFLRRMLLSRVNGLIGRLDEVGEPSFSLPESPDGADELSRIERALGNASRSILKARRQNDRLRQLYQTLSEANQSIIRLPDRPSVYRRICEVIVEYGGFPLAWIGEPDREGRLALAAASGATDCLAQLDLALSPESDSLAARVLHRGRVEVVNDIDAPDASLARRDLARRNGFAAVAVFPLRCAGRIVALMAVYATEAGFFNDTETGLLTELAGDVSFALDNYWRAEALRESEARNRKLFLSSPHPIWLCDLETRAVMDVNDVAVKHYGFTRDEFLSMSIDDLTVDDEASTQDEEKRTRRHRRKDGSVIDVEITSHALDWKDRRAELVLANDVTDRVRAEHELRIAAAAFEVQEGILVANANNVIERVNQAFTRITGYEPHEIIGKTPSVLQSGLHDEAFYEEMWQQIGENGFWEGEVWNRRKNGDIYPEWLAISAVKDARGRITHYVGSCLDITEDKEAERKIHQLAFYDPLTDLANRRLLIDRLGRALAVSNRTGRYGAVLMLDFDHFKILNDTRGHAAGDALLVEAAKRLKNGVRESDSVARMGGDEFVVVLEGLHPDEETASGEAVRRARQLQLTLAKPYHLPEASDYRIGISVGITLFKGHELLVDDLLKQADVALYEAKSEGRNALRFFNPERQRAIEIRAKTEEELRRAIQKEEFTLYYQPQFNREGLVTGAEALVRWLPPGRGLVLPAEFIPIAEESGQILAIGNWVVKTALDQLKAWGERPETRHLTLSVNISAKHFRQPGFAKEIREHLERNGADPSRLFLELTENVGIEPIDRIVRQFNALKALNIRFSIDDFGTGYSSLSYIQRLPVNQIKIDRSFINGLPDDPNGAAVVRAILAMSHAFKLKVIAEGVETTAQRDFLQAEGCDAYQGYYFGRPLPVSDFEAMLPDHLN